MYVVSPLLSTHNYECGLRPPPLQSGGHPPYGRILPIHSEDPFSLLRQCSSRNRALKISNHKTFMGPWGPNVAHGPRWAHLGPWATGVGDHSPRAQGAVMNCAQKPLFKELRVLCREFRNSLTSEKGVSNLEALTGCEY